MAGEVTLPEVLEARENRALAQKELLDKRGFPVLSFSMNIPGPVKDTPLIRRAYFIGREMLLGALAEEEIFPAEQREVLERTGCELLLSVPAPAEEIKRLTVAIEECCPMGRLFDMDVIATDGHKLEREGERGCIVCGRPGRGCASRRVHTLQELKAATENLIISGLAASDRDDVAEKCTDALLREVNATPKPGLVDRRNTGSHRDMDIWTFYRSAQALKPYWGECFTLGRESRDKAPEETFALLRQAGLRAEKAMYAATNGVNTHKGVIFTLGTLCGAVGRLWTPEAPCRDPRTLTQEAARLYAPVLAADLRAMDGATAGERIYLQTGETGIRGELAAGLPGVIDIALPALERALSLGADEDTACAAALLRLIGRNTDTNMIHRGGAAQAAKASREALALAEEAPLPSREALEALDESFIARNLSPGGCADALAVTLFLHLWKKEANKVS